VSRLVRPEEGLFLAVKASGFVGNGGSNGSGGPKLYIHESVAVKKAGPGGSVYRIRLTGYGMVIERVSGPPLHPRVDEVLE